jgi:peptidoglycan-N-acetylglucosamine deacetylase
MQLDGHDEVRTQTAIMKSSNIKFPLTLFSLAAFVMAGLAAEAEQVHTVAPKKGTVQLDDKINIADEEAVIPEKLDIVGPSRITILSKTFHPSPGRKFKSFGTTHVDVQADPTLVAIARPKDSPDEIKVMGTFLNVTAVKFPLRTEGNLTGGGGGGGAAPELPHWSAKMGAIVVVLTFDDGPHYTIGKAPGRTEPILETLKNNPTQKEIKASFFVQSHVPNRGGSVTGAAVMKKEADQGHLVDPHTGSVPDHVAHPVRVKLPAYDYNYDGIKDGKNALESDLLAAIARIKAQTGQPPKYVRPPYGSYNPDVLKVYSDVQLKMILWDIDSKDSAKGTNDALVRKSLADQLKQRINQNKTEVVVLFHDINKTTSANLSEYIKLLKDVALSEGIELVFTKKRDQVEAIFDKRTDGSK